MRCESDLRAAGVGRVVVSADVGRGCGVDLVAGHLHDHGFPRDEVVEPVESGGFEVVPTLFGQGYWLNAGQIDRARPIECGEVGWQGVEEASLAGVWTAESTGRSLGLGWPVIELPVGLLESQQRAEETSSGA